MKNFLLLCLLLSLAACSPRIHYLGDTYSPTTKVDVFYDEGDIKKDYKVIGQLSGENSLNTTIELDTVREKMIEKAREKGADAILFLFHDSYGENHNVQAKLLRYHN